MRRFFLDTNAWLDLLTRKATSPQRSALLMRIMEVKDLELACDLELMAELANEEFYDSERFKPAMDYLGLCTDGRVLLPCNLRMAMEILRGEELTDREIFLPYLGQKGVVGYQLTKPRGDICSLDSGHKADFADALQEARAGALPHKPETYPDQVENYFEHLAKGLLSAREVLQLPACRAFLGFEVACQGLKLRDALPMKGLWTVSDLLYDQIVYADAMSANAAFFVSEDKLYGEMDKALTHVVPKAPQRMTFDTFIEMVAEPAKASA
jgi:hypothetical protein